MDGLCLPQGNQVLLGPVRINFLGRIVYPEQDGTTTVESSRGLGSGPGQMSLPLSMAGGADGRVYVLDAGNSRIEVFDVAGNYITQWGVPGTGAGEFDFGSGWLEVEDFIGSVAVDGEGNIYVADRAGLGRIQVFSP